MKLLNTTKNITLVENLDSATTLFARMKGLLGRQSLANDSALWIHRCTSIHTFFMQFTIDVAFIDKKYRVKKIYQNLKPWRAAWHLWGADSVIEFSKGTLTPDKIEVGDQLNVVS